MKVYLKERTNYYFPVRYVLKIIEKNQSVRFTWVERPAAADLCWDDTHPASQPLALSFYDALATDDPDLRHSTVFREAPVIRTSSGEKDLIATVFYLINCLQEFNADQTQLDAFGRFAYHSSYQYRFGNLQENLVQREIDQFVKQHDLPGVARKSTFFVSHDIDSLYGSWLQDGFWALKRLNIVALLNLIAAEFARRPAWRNIDRIIALDTEHDVRSTFFWLVNRGRGTHGIRNADYAIRREGDLLERVARAGLTNGLHKSCSAMSIDEERARAPLNSSSNRYHFLNFLPHRDWRRISDSGLNFDASLGFAEHYGFRNSYGRAFQPFDHRHQRPYDFVEAPLTFMDTTFHKYLDTPPDRVGDVIIDFYERNATHCDLSLLWHNNYVSDYKYGSFLKEYKKVLAYLYESNIDCLTPQELVEQNQLEW